MKIHSLFYWRILRACLLARRMRVLDYAQIAQFSRDIFVHFTILQFSQIYGIISLRLRDEDTLN